MTIEQYYTAPPNEIFEEIKAEAIKIWQTYDDNYGYASEKINRIKDLPNVSCNAWTICAMFDGNNLHKLLDMVSDQANEMILDALKT